MFSKIQPVAQHVICSRSWLLCPRSHLTLSGSDGYTCNMLSLPYHHLPDTDRNKQPLILLAPQKKHWRCRAISPLKSETTALAQLNTQLISLVNQLPFHFSHFLACGNQINGESGVRAHWGIFFSYNAVTLRKGWQILQDLFALNLELISRCATVSAQSFVAGSRDRAADTACLCWHSWLRECVRATNDLECLCPCHQAGTVFD